MCVYTALLQGISAVTPVATANSVTERRLGEDLAIGRTLAVAPKGDAVMKTNPFLSGGRVHAEGPRPQRPWQIRVGFWLLLAIAGFYLLAEHRAHLAGSIRWLPVGLLLLCPLMHLFMHGSHGAHGKHGANTPVDSDSHPEPGTSHDTSDTQKGGR